MTQEMNPRKAPIQYVRLFQNVTSLEMYGKEIIKKQSPPFCLMIIHHVSTADNVLGSKLLIMLHFSNID